MSGLMARMGRVRCQVFPPILLAQLPASALPMDTRSPVHGLFLLRLTRDSMGRQGRLLGAPALIFLG